MKRSRMAGHGLTKALSIFANAAAPVELCDNLRRLAVDEMTEIKRLYRNHVVTFDYDDEIVPGKFVDAVPGDFPGTYMIVLQLASSRACDGPCFMHLHGRRVGGIAVTGPNGLVGFTTKAGLRKRAAHLPRTTRLLAECA